MDITKIMTPIALWTHGKIRFANGDVLEGGDVPASVNHIDIDTMRHLLQVRARRTRVKPEGGFPCWQVQKPHGGDGREGNQMIRLWCQNDTHQVRFRVIDGLIGGKWKIEVDLHALRKEGLPIRLFLLGAEGGIMDQVNAVRWQHSVRSEQAVHDNAREHFLFLWHCGFVKQLENVRHRLDKKIMDALGDEFFSKE